MFYESLGNKICRQLNEDTPSIGRHNLTSEMLRCKEMHFKIDSEMGRWCVTSHNLTVWAGGTASVLVGIRPFSVLPLGCGRGDSTYVSLRRRQRNRAAARRAKGAKQETADGTEPLGPWLAARARDGPAPSSPAPPRKRVLSPSTSLATGPFIARVPSLLGLSVSTHIARDRRRSGSVWCAPRPRRTQDGDGDHRSRK